VPSEGVGEGVLSGKSREWIRKQLRSSIQSITAMVNRGFRID
jgi:hypothetical protein